MPSKTLRTVSLLGILGAALFTTSSQAHECRALGQVNAEGSPGDPSATPPVPPHAVDDAYWVCIGFSEEEPPQPGEGLPNNLDFFPLFAPGNDFNNVSSVDTTKGDKVDITATLYYLNDKYYVIPYDADFNITVPFFFFKSSGVGYEFAYLQMRFDALARNGTARRRAACCSAGGRRSVSRLRKADQSDRETGMGRLGGVSWKEGIPPALSRDLCLGCEGNHSKERPPTGDIYDKGGQPAAKSPIWTL